MPKMSLKFSYSLMSQNEHLLGNSGIGFPTDIWVPSTTNIKPETAIQYSFGIYSKLLNNCQITIEAYYKELNNIVDFSQGTNFLENGPETNLLEESETDWQKRVISGKGNAYGIEFYAKKEAPKWSLTTAYTYSKAQRKFSAINNGKEFPFRYNRNHVLNLDFIYKINKRISFTTSWQYMSGFYVSLPLRKYLSTFEEQADEYNYVITEKSAKNNYQTPAYHRLDFGFNFTKKKKRGEAIWNLGIYNVYNRKNTYAILPMGVDLEEITQISLFPILPSISYRYVFQ